MPTPLDDVPFVSLETFRKDGSGVKTPMWVAPLDGKLIFGTVRSTHKIKRIGNDPRVRVAACNVNGKVTRGPWFEGTARVLEGVGAEPGERALDRKYGWQRRPLTFLAKLFGRMKNRVIIEVVLTPPG